MTVMFKVGEKVVYPAHGVGVIEGIQTRVVSGSERKFYMLRILDSDMTIMIPTENVNAVGLRRIIGKDMVAKVYRILRDNRPGTVGIASTPRRSRPAASSRSPRCCATCSC